MPALTHPDFRHRALYGSELLALMLSACAGMIVAGFSTLVLSGSRISDDTTKAGSLVLLLALLPILLSLAPGALLQVAAAPNHAFRFHVHLSFFAGALYFLGWLALVLLATAVHSRVSALVTVIAWCYYLIGPVVLPLAMGVVADRFEDSPA